ncbi:MAG: septum formation inhibitor Maf, partial [Rhodoferax sp.]|nr:septum formation inhibitor Maf [Rhodoferax sp.]
APARYVRRVTGLKLQAALARLRRSGWPAAPVLCADTTVALGAEVLGKPADAGEAHRMLARLSGRMHRVLTAVAVGDLQGRLGQAMSVSRVRFAALDAGQIAHYVASGEPMGKAGAYGVQGSAAAFIPHLCGSYSGIMGLPLHETACLLRDFDWPGAAVGSR